MRGRTYTVADNIWIYKRREWYWQSIQKHRNTWAATRAFDQIGMGSI